MIDKKLINAYVRIFSVHQSGDTMKKWESFSLEILHAKSEHIVGLLNLPQFKEWREICKALWRILIIPPLFF